MTAFSVKFIGQENAFEMTDAGSVELTLVKLRVNGHRFVLVMKKSPSAMLLDLQHDGSAHTRRFLDENSYGVKEAIMCHLADLDEPIMIGEHTVSFERGFLN